MSDAYAPVRLPANSGTARSGFVTLERLVNLYVEANPPGSRAPVTLYPTPGLKPFVTLATAPVRGLILMGPAVYVVSGERLYTVDNGAVVTDIGYVGGAGPVRMVQDGTNVAITTSGPAYAGNASSGLVTLPESSLCGAAYQDGIGVFTQSGGQFVWATDVGDLTSIPGTSFTSADVQADLVVGCVSDHRELAVFKERSTEFYYNAGASPFPFLRSQGFIERGAASSGSIAKVDNQIIWLGDDLRVYATAGYSPRPISTVGVDNQIKDAGGHESAEAFVYRQGGHIFYVLSFADLTLSYDTSTGLWHERASYGAARWRAQGYAFAWERHLVGDFETGDVYELDLNTYDDNGDPQVREAYTAPFQTNGHRALMPEVYCEMEAGVGLATGQGSDPKCELSWSDDGGHTWEGLRLAGFGAIGDYGARAVWTRLGAFRNRSLRFRVSDPVKTVLIQPYARLEGAR